MRRCQRQRQRLSACVTVAALLALLGVGWVSAPPVVAQSLPAVAAAAPGLTSPTFLPDGAHLAPGVTLRLAALGRGDAFTPVDTVTPTDDGTRAEYAHGNVTEWYLRQGGGVEQGITLAAPPVGDGLLVLTIATPGAAVLVNDTGDAATLILPDKTRWQYDGLHVTDATGQVLPSRLTQAADGGIGITADDTGAVYPVTVDPFVQQQTFSEPNPATNNAFGSAVAMSADGTTLAIGAPYTSGTFQGRAYVFVRSGSGSSYGPPLTLSAPGAATGDSFGNAMALNADGSTLVVGAYGTSSFQGKAYVFNPERRRVQLVPDPQRTRCRRWRPIWLCRGIERGRQHPRRRCALHE